MHADASDPLPPVVLLHGFGTSAESTWRANGWVDLLEDAGRTVVAPDLLGHGSAPKPHDPEAYAALEDDVRRALPPGTVDAIGFSLGARVLLTLAAAEPHRFRRIVVAGVGANLFRADDPELLAAAIEAGPVDRADEGAHPWAGYFRQLAHAPGNDPRALVAYLRRPHGPPLTADALGSISSPVLVALGDRDHAGPAEPLLDTLRDASFVRLPNTDHFATPKSFAFLDAALGFLALDPTPVPRP